MTPLVLTLAVAAVVAFLLGAEHYRHVRDTEGAGAAFVHWLGAFSLVIGPVFAVLWLFGVVR